MGTGVDTTRITMAAITYAGITHTHTRKYDHTTCCIAIVYDLSDLIMFPISTSYLFISYLFYSTYMLFDLIAFIFISN